jgi:hypothetical protein
MSGRENLTTNTAQLSRSLTGQGKNKYMYQAVINTVHNLAQCPTIPPQNLPSVSHRRSEY